ncbi:MAG TPA: DNA translocase FtsK 4TM domain-containing protein, partial [Thermoanaerobaculia bacterium]|nr:DNA translocase FtsK 4TM domain-containing protein [Thermoanaerobaculia bacterium]
MQLTEFFRSRRGGELIGIVILAIGISLGAAILTWHPRDSSAFYTSTDTEVHNAIGYYGATLAWIFLGFFGFASLLFPAVLLLVGWNRFWGRDIEYFHTKLIGFVVVTLSLPPLFDLAVGKIWIRGALLAAGGYLGQEINEAVRGNLNTSGAVIALVTAFLIGLLLSTRISLAAVFLALHNRFAALGRAISMHWARLSERRRKERMKDALVRKHLEKAEAPALRLVRAAEPEATLSSAPALRGPVVREVQGRGSFQIRKVTKADLRKAAETLASQPEVDPSQLYRKPEAVPAPQTSEPRPAPRRAPTPVPPIPDLDDFEDPLWLDEPRSAKPDPPKPSLPRPTMKRRESTKREVRLTHDLLPPMDLLIEGPKQDTINDEVHKKYLEIGRLIEDRCREFSVEGEVTAYHPGPVVTTFEFKPSAGVKYAKVVNLGDDLALALKAESIRIERISGSSTVGIEVPNRKRELIALRDIIDTEAFSGSSSLLTLALGKDIHGESVVTDLAKMPHLLVAGATGAGKSVGLNSMIVSLLYKAL